MTAISVKAWFEAELILTVDTESDNEAVTTADVQQAVQDAIGFTGIDILDVTEWTQL